MSSQFEIERKFLIKKIDVETLLKNVEGYLGKTQIEQIYLVSSQGERRIRKKTQDGKTTYFYTEKIPITEFKRIENESQITEAEYLSYLEQADKNLFPVRKTRYTFTFKGQLLELDIYSFSSSMAILEIELPSESASVELPKFIEVLEDVTYNKAYKNHSLAKSQSL